MLHYGVPLTFHGLDGVHCLPRRQVDGRVGVQEEAYRGPRLVPAEAGAGWRLQPRGPGHFFLYG